VVSGIQCIAFDLNKLWTIRTLIAIDGHTHIYSAIRPEYTPVTGGENLKQLVEPGACTVCSLCDPVGSDTFSRLRDLSDADSGAANHAGCSVSTTSESTSLTMSKGNEASVVVIRGQQLVSSENLEVLAIGHTTNLKTGRPLHKTLDQARAAGAHMIIPWGAGKWIGTRGKLVSGKIQRQACPGPHLGDNDGGRPAVCRVPQFRFAAERGIKIISGSDPLPIAGDERRIGTYGMVIDGQLDTASPWQSIASFLADPNVQPETIGSNLRFARFLLLQSKLRFKVLYGCDWFTRIRMLQWESNWS